MKRCIYIATQVFIVTSLHAAEPTATFNNYNYIVDSSISQEHIESVTQTISTTLNHISEKIQGAQETGHKYFSQVCRYCDTTAQWVWEHPILTTLGSACCAHVALNTYAWWIARTLNDSSSWSMWKYHLANEELSSIPIQTLGYDLMCEIQRRYFTPENPTDTTQPIIRFYESITHEYTLMQRYKFICDTLDWCYLQRVSWYNEKLHNMIEHHMQRLHMLWHIFVSWVADHNIDQQIKNSLVRADISHYHPRTAYLLRRTHFYYPYL